MYARYFFFVLFALITKDALATTAQHAFFRSVWLPTYHGQRLSYCNEIGAICGKKVASHYCRLLGYTASASSLIDYNVRLSRFLDSNKSCHGMSCYGFKTIRCVGYLPHHPPKSYYYRLKQVVFPRYNQSRIDWCYDGRRGCGYRAAYSFCRRLGYDAVKRYTIDRHVGLTVAIGNQKKCLGNFCKGFSSIICYR